MNALTPFPRKLSYTELPDVTDFLVSSQTAELETEFAESISAYELASKRRRFECDPIPAKKILIVDDEPNIRLAIRSCLELEGYEICEASTGGEAISTIKEFTPDLVLLDLAMPELDGLSALRVLSTMRMEAMPKIAILTAYGSVCAADRAFDFGACAFLEKPLAPDALRDAVATILSHDSKPRYEQRDKKADEESTEGLFFG